MSLEFCSLFLAMVLGLTHVAAASFSFKAQVGNRYTVGARDEDLQPVGVAARLHRAQRNFLETFAIFAIAILLVHDLGQEAWLSRTGAMTYLAGRVLFLPLYALGVVWLRTLAWCAATLGLIMVMAQAIV